MKLVAWALATGLRAGAGTIGDRFRSPEAAARSARARRAAATRRFVAILGDLKGLFAKAGQFASLRHDLLPAETSAALAALRDRVPPLPFDAIRRAVEAEIHGPLARSFREFDSTPLGAAAVAQVHRAVLPDGTAVAVKVQYPWIAASVQSDLRLARRVLRLWVAVTGRRDVDTEGLFAEFASALREELDFALEARAARQIAANLAADPQVVVPEIIDALSTPRLLTMRYLECVRIDDRAALARLGVRPADVLTVIARAYAKQVFADGLFHADPHPGNLFVIDEAGAGETPRVLFVDFGLCKRLTPEMRGQLRRAIYAILQRDAAALDTAVGEMGMVAPGAEAGVAKAIEAMFERLAEAAGSGGVLGIGSSSLVLSLKDEAKRLLQDTPGLQLPNDLVLYAKTMSYLFALGEELDPEVDLMKISLPYLMQFLATRE